MLTDLQARDFTVTPALRRVVEAEAERFGARYGRFVTKLSVRLYDTNGHRGGPDKGCRVHVRLTGGRAVVSSVVDADLYKAIPAAFDQAERSAKAKLARGAARRAGLELATDAG
jgi:ribosomal subunit interface protein